MSALLKELEVAGERFVKLGEGALLVASKSEPGTWHHLTGQTCDCKGFQYRGHCRHIAAALELEAATTTDTTVTVEITPDFGGGWVVRWLGTQHGGTHSRREDAEAHAEELRQAPAWDRQAWQERHPAPVPAGRPTLYVVGKEQVL
jgi:hypothetical protein